MEDPVVPLERNLYGHPLVGLLWERQFEKIQWGLQGRLKPADEVKSQVLHVLWALTSGAAKVK